MQSNKEDEAPGRSIGQQIRYYRTLNRTLKRRVSKEKRKVERLNRLRNEFDKLQMELTELLGGNIPTYYKK